MNRAFLHTIIIYTLATCPYCIQAKKLLDDKGAKYEEIEVSKFTEQQRQALAKRAGDKRSVPQIFIGDKHIGGRDDLFKLDEEGKLDNLINEDKMKSSY